LNSGGVFQESQDFPIPVASLNARDAEDLLRYFIKFCAHHNFVLMLFNVAGL
jgi:hypothetical protein